MDNRKHICISILMITLLALFIVNLPKIYDNYEEIPGIYKATYNFKGEIGKTGDNIGFIDYSYAEDDCSAEVIEEIDGHKNILKITDESTEGYIKIYNYLDELTSGTHTIEFWWYPEDKGDGQYYYFGVSGGGYNAIRIYYDCYIEGFIITTGDGNTFISAKSDSWHYIIVQIDLDDDDVSVWINSKVKIDAENFWDTSFNYFSKVAFQTAITQTGTFYLDAIGYSWDVDYFIGDNLHLEKTLHPIICMWYIFFSGVLIITFIVILNPKDSLPFLVRFLVKREIITKKKYIQILNSIFLIFKKRIVLKNIKWNVYEAAKTSIDIISELNGNQEVIRICDNSRLGRGYIRNKIFSNQKTGSIEWRWRMTDTSKGIIFSLINTDLYEMILIKIENGNVYACNGKDYQNLQEINTNQWYYMRIDFECAKNTFDLYIDGTRKVYRFNLINSSTFPKFTQFYTNIHQSQYCIYIADFKYKWGDSPKI